MSDPFAPPAHRAYKALQHEIRNLDAALDHPLEWNLARYDPALLAKLDPAPGHRVLDLACGPGEPSLTLSRLVGPEGSVVGLDLSSAMVQHARAQATSEAAGNACFVHGDPEDLPLAAASFHRVACRFGLPLTDGLHRALSEARRVLEPGGRFVALAWAGPGDQVPALSTFMAAVCQNTAPAGLDRLPDPWAWGAPGTLLRAFQAAGFQDVEQELIEASWTFQHLSDYLTSMASATPHGQVLQGAPARTRQRVLEDLCGKLPLGEMEDGLRLRADAVLVAGHR